MDIGSLLIADAQSAKLVEPGKAPLDDPAPSAQTAAVLGVTLCEQRLNMSGAQTLPDSFGVITANRSEARPSHIRDFRVPGSLLRVAR